MWPRRALCGPGVTPRDAAPLRLAARGAASCVTPPLGESAPHAPWHAAPHRSTPHCGAAVAHAAPRRNKLFRNGQLMFHTSYEGPEPRDLAVRGERDLAVRGERDLAVWGERELAVWGEHDLAVRG